MNSRLHFPYSISSSPSPRGALSTAQVLSGTSYMSVTEILFSGTTATTLPTQLAIDTTAIVESRSFPSAPGFTVVGFTPKRSIFILPTDSSDPGDTGPSTAVLPSLLAVLGLVAVAIGTLLCWMGRWKPRRIRMSLASGRAPRGESRHRHAQMIRKADSSHAVRQVVWATADDAETVTTSVQGVIGSAVGSSTIVDLGGGSGSSKEGYRGATGTRQARAGPPTIRSAATADRSSVRAPSFRERLRAFFAGARIGGGSLSSAGDPPPAYDAQVLPEYDALP